MSGGEAAPPLPPFNPLDIADLKLWLDASQIVGLNAGDSVTTWSDLSGNGYNFTQSTGSKKPTYQINIQNGRAGVLADGVDDLMTGTLFSNVYGAGEFTELVVIKPTALTSTSATPYLQQQVFTSTAGAYLGIGLKNDGTISGYSYDGTYDNVSVTGAVVGTACLLEFYKSSGTLYLTRDNTVSASVATGNNTATVSEMVRILGGYNGTLGFFTGYLLDKLVYKRALSTIERDTVRDYLRSKWATP